MEIGKFYLYKKKEEEEEEEKKKEKFSGTNVM